MKIKTIPEIVSFPTNEIVQKEANNFWIKSYLPKSTDWQISDPSHTNKMS